MVLRLVQDATVEPVSALELKKHLRLSTLDTSEDAQLESFEKSARLIAENKCKRSFGAEIWQLTFDSFPTGGIELPRPPLSTAAGAVTITYTDSSGAIATLASTSIVVDSDSEPGWVFPSTALDDWPDTDDVVNAVKVQYQTSSNAIPEPVKIWIKLRVGSMYENREAANVLSGSASIEELPRSYVDGLLDPYVIPGDV